MLSKRDIEIIKNYHDNVILISTLQQQIAWNQRHGLPVISLSARVADLKRQLLQFEDILDTINDRQARNIICCRFVLRMNNRQVAEVMLIHRNTVAKKLASVMMEQ